MTRLKSFLKKNKEKIGLKLQSSFIWVSVIVGLGFTALTFWAIIYFFQQAFIDGFL
ncbi:hypothetical protein [Mesomycoplasma ovipneumoniae]|uniref:hypothetical protein n=1 Tax=Mesomycoplasma ovipneumoniae TaxID=29562 RepID=UPI0028ACBCD6|nr:hypothetical protein [Mesomycoplasma ovipneumoniae]MDW2910202.1 hypothetical protein [Mesomycoplasma ovipneumoniae]MDW2910479.1 hypothetical protein [Mesomycoplasma ovipneumoniae]MDW2917727.1 hypothetical protein [Mesomycoplasma ovipneumoniae]MDW2920407.1 hypothetical protein [Mesomycoplasma ovipneumoniae]MDW2927773.1 hypothetical protein [Mesomycoplasma ovipneumoniae]